MSFKHVEVKKKANVYHNGQCTSRSIIDANGEVKTLGIMLPGTYRFNTDAAETIDVTQGHCRVKIGAENQWSEYRAGASFAIPAQSHFEIKVESLLDYVCHFAKK